MFYKKKKGNGSLILDLYFTFMAHFDPHSFYFTISLRNPKSVEKEKDPEEAHYFKYNGMSNIVFHMYKVTSTCTLITIC